MKLMTKDVPAYAMIAMLGGASVTFYKRPSGHGGETSGSHTGYDEEALLEQYRGSGIPLIDMRTVERYQSPPFYCRETTICTGGRYVSLEEYVEFYRSIGATISTL